MKKGPEATKLALLILGAGAILVGCSDPKPAPAPKTPPAATAPSAGNSSPNQTSANNPTGTPSAPTPVASPAPSTSGKAPDNSPVAANPSSIEVLVNKSMKLPDGYRPNDLVAPNVPFIFKEQDEKRLMRKEAAHALELMFAGAKQDGVQLAGVSGFRSYETQEALYAYYIRTQGEEWTLKYSAAPGHSEHQTGLTMDVSGIDGKCAADDCFAGTPEANWLASHAGEYGFIIRYPKGKEAVTGYAYEPWHVRYVGVATAKAVASSGLALDEYLARAH